MNPQKRNESSFNYAQLQQGYSEDYFKQTGLERYSLLTCSEKKFKTEGGT
jgi:hypothetical protein